MSEVYVSTDIETDGPIPGDFSMLSLASAAFDEDGHLLDVWSANILALPEARQDPDTMQFWATEPEAWASLQDNKQTALRAMRAYRKWVESLPGKPVFVAYPAGFDFTFVYWYLIHFTGKSPFSFSALDMKSYASAKLGIPYRNATKRAWPKEWHSAWGRHTHIALDDAIEQGEQFMRMKRLVFDKDGH
jgi:hypothetical protein